MPSIFDYGAEITDSKDSKLFRSVGYYPSFPISGLKKDYVRSYETFRADKIANRHYEDPTLSWVIDCANNFYHGYKEYTIERVFLYPSIETLQTMGIIE